MSNHVPFAGRQDALQLIDSMINSSGNTWLLWVVAPGGSGKSRLLEAILQQFTPPDYIHSGLLDFFSASLRLRDHILVELANRFEVYVGRFAEDFTAYQQVLQTEDMDAHSAALQQVENTLVGALRNRFAEYKRGLIVADTTELVAHSPTGYWFFVDFLPKLAPLAVIIAAGREIPNEANLILRQSGATGEPLHLVESASGILDDYWKKVSQTGTNDNDPDFEKHIPTGLMDKIAGKPILLALAAAVLNQKRVDQSLSYEGLLATDIDELIKQIANPINSNESPHLSVIYRMSYINRRFDKEILKWLMSPSEPGTNHEEHL